MGECGCMARPVELVLFPQTPHLVHDEKGWEWALRPPLPPGVHLGREGWAAQPVCGLTAGPRGPLQHV